MAAEPAIPVNRIDYQMCTLEEPISEKILEMNITRMTLVADR